MSATQIETNHTLAEMKAAARAAHLRYVSDEKPGIRRIRTPNGFRYVAPDGSRITDEETISRIQKLAIPPAYEDVWITPTAICRLSAAMPAAASSTATTSAGAKSATSRNTRRC